jgi:arginine exporter protein ArgO
MPENVKYQDSVRSMAVVVGAIVLVCLFATAIAVAAAVGHGINSSTTPVVTTVLTTLGGAVIGLLALVKATHAEQKTDAVNVKVDGHLLRLSTIATEAAAASGNPAVIAEAEQASAAAREVIDSPIPPPAGASS